MSSYVNHFHKITIFEPTFSKFYNNHYKETDYNKYHDEILEIIKKHLRHLLIKESRDVGISINIESTLYKPLVAKGLELDDVVYIIRELFSDEIGYLQHSLKNPDSLSLTTKGKNWLMDRKSGEANLPAVSYGNYFDIPDKSSEKIKILLKEINDLPNYNCYSNLIGHQLRTIFALTLVEVCEKLLKIKIPKEDKQYLKKLLNFTIKECKIKEKRLAEELEHFKQTKYKDIIDDIIHCDYTTINPEIVKEIMLKIKHLLSLIYRDI